MCGSLLGPGSNLSNVFLKGTHQYNYIALATLHFVAWTLKLPLNQGISCVESVLYLSVLSLALIDVVTTTVAR